MAEIHLKAFPSRQPYSAGHANLVNQVTKVADQAFGPGLTIDLNIAGAMLVVTGLVCGVIYLWPKPSINGRPAVS